MTGELDIFDEIVASNVAKEKVEMSLRGYLDLCKSDSTAYASASERMLQAIGKPVLLDTSTDERLSRVFFNRTIKVYPAFKDFYGIEETIESIVNFYTHAAQGLEEKKQMLYLLGPVGSSKSSLAERLKSLMEACPFYSLAFKDQKTGEVEISPIFESPLGLFSTQDQVDKISEQYNIALTYFPMIMSPWAVKRLASVNGDISKFMAVRLY